jgi:hypothetical protein
LLDSCAKTEVIAELDIISRRCNPVATSSNFGWYNLAMDDEVDVDDEEADEQPKNKQPRTTPWPCRLQALDLQNRFHFQTCEVARKTLNIASLRDMKVMFLRSVISVQPFGKWYARSLGSTASP